MTTRLPFRKTRDGFTIVELLVATAITVFIVVLLGTMFGSLTSTTTRSNHRTDAFRDARAALQMMQRDLSGLVRTQWDVKANPPPIPITRPAAYLALKSLYGDPATLSPATDNQQIYALIALKNKDPGDVCSVGYYCRWDTDPNLPYGPAKNFYRLHRFFTPSVATYNNLTNPTVANHNYASDADLYTPSSTDEVLASYVWGLRVTPYDAAGAVLTTPYPYVCDSSATTNDPVPAAIEISFKVMSPEAARTLVSVSADPLDWMDATRSRYKLLVAPNAYEFHTRIKF